MPLLHRVPETPPPPLPAARRSWWRTPKPQRVGCTLLKPAKPSRREERSKPCRVVLCLRCSGCGRTLLPVSLAADLKGRLKSGRLVAALAPPTFTPVLPRLYCAQKVLAESSEHLRGGVGWKSGPKSQGNCACKDSHAAAHRCPNPGSSLGLS